MGAPVSPTVEVRPTGVHGGFTLVELLVVMVLVSLISGILMETLSQVWRIQARSGVEIARMGEQAMLLDWYRQTVRTLIPDFERGTQNFSGEADGFRGLSTTPLKGDEGAPTLVSWTIKTDVAGTETRLLYAGETLIRWPRTSGMAFSYLDPEGVEHRAWPPPLGKFLPLPSVVLLSGVADGEPIRVVAAPQYANEYPVRPFNPLGSGQ